MILIATLTALGVPWDNNDFKMSSPKPIVRCHRQIIVPASATQAVRNPWIVPKALMATLGEFITEIPSEW